MSTNFQENFSLPVSPNQLSEIFTSTMQRVYLWMALGLMLTTATAVFTVNSPAMLNFVFSSNIVFFGLMIGELALVIALSAAINKLSPAMGLTLFFGYAALNGITMSVIFLAYTLSTIYLAFGVTATLFGILSIIGYTTKQDLSKWGGILLMGLVGVIVASIANLFLANSTLDWIITYAGVLLFMGLTVYDTQRIKKMAHTAALAGASDEVVVQRIGIMGALKLYLDFINLFLFILRLFGRRR